MIDSVKACFFCCYASNQKAGAAAYSVGTVDRTITSREKQVVPQKLVILYL